MRYHLIALVHGSSASTSGNREDPAGRISVPAVVEHAGREMRKRAVAMIETGRRLEAEEVSKTAKLLYRRLQQAFAKRGLTISDPELVEE